MRRSLFNVGLQGTMPTDGWDLPQGLVLLNLAGNDLQGPLPVEWPGAPPNLVRLEFYENQLTGGCSSSSKVRVWN